MTSQPPPGDFPRYTSTPDQEALELGPTHNRPHRGPGQSGPGRPVQLEQPQSAQVGNARRVAATAGRTQDWWQEKLHQLSLHARVTLLAAVAVGLAVAIVSLSAYVTVRQQMYRNLDQSLKGRAVQAANNQVLTNNYNLQIASAGALGLSDIRVGVYLQDGQIVGPVDSALPPMGATELAVARGTAPEGYSIQTVGVPNHSHFRVIAVPAQFCPREDRKECLSDQTVPSALVVAQSLKPIDQTLHNLGIVLWAVGLLGVIGAALAGNAIAQSGLRPLARLTGAAENIAGPRI